MSKQFNDLRNLLVKEFSSPGTTPSDEVGDSALSFFQNLKKTLTSGTNEEKREAQLEFFETQQLITKVLQNSAKSLGLDSSAMLDGSVDMVSIAKQKYSKFDEVESLIREIRENYELDTTSSISSKPSKGMKRSKIENWEKM